MLLYLLLTCIAASFKMHMLMLFLLIVLEFDCILSNQCFQFKGTLTGVMKTRNEQGLQMTNLNDVG